MSSVRNRVRIGIVLLAVAFLAPSSASFAGDTPDLSPAQRKLQDIVASLKERLVLPAPVVVAIESTNALMMSVEAPTAQGSPFTLAVDGTFLETLTDVELEAAVAHELGHVWVFTHHPYLQTEELANQIAMRVVTRDSLQRVYEKMWRQNGTKGNLLEFLGPESAGRSAR